MMISLDGFFEGENHDLSWHNVDQEFVAFAIEQLKEIDTIIFGKTTYEMMASFWPSETAKKDDPITAALMTETSKIVFSRTLETADWKNTKLIKENLENEIKKLKEQPGKDIAVFGSNNLSVQLLQLGLLDEVRIMINPVAICKGTLLFSGIQNKISLTLLKTRVFANGNVLIHYQP